MQSLAQKSPPESPPGLARLPWERYPFLNGFHALPDGTDQRHRYAMIWPDAGARHGDWRWLVRIDPPDRSPADFVSGAYRNGVVASKQAAADAATAAWHELSAGLSSAPL